MRASISDCAPTTIRARWRANRAALRELPAAGSRWLRQVHGSARRARRCSHRTRPRPTLLTRAALERCARSWSPTACRCCCAIRRRSVVAIAHAGWRGLERGVIENTIAAMGVKANDLLAYLGPAIGPAAFEVGADVRDAFLAADAAAAAAFTPHRARKMAGGPVSARAASASPARGVHASTAAGYAPSAIPRAFIRIGAIARPAAWRR